MNFFKILKNKKKDITFIDRCYKYYNDKENDLSPCTVQAAHCRIKKHLEPYWGDKKLTDISIKDYQDFIIYIYSNKSLKKRTCDVIVEIPNAVLHECYKLQEIDKNLPDFKIVTRKNDSEEKKIYTIEEVKKILAIIDSSEKYHPLHHFIYIMVLTGMRFGEVAGLLWENVDFDNNVIKVRTNLIRANHKFYLKSVKTQNGIRDLKVPARLMEILYKEKERQAKLKATGKINNEYDFVCLNARNNYICNGTLKEMFKRFCEKHNIRYLGFHALRHTHATSLLLAGVDMKTISKRLGHRDIQITMNVYSHVLEEMDNKAANKIEELFL